MNRLYQFLSETLNSVYFSLFWCAEQQVARSLQQKGEGFNF